MMTHVLLFYIIVQIKGRQPTQKFRCESHAGRYRLNSRGESCNWYINNNRPITFRIFKILSLHPPPSPPNKKKYIYIYWRYITAGQLSSKNPTQVFFHMAVIYMDLLLLAFVILWASPLWILSPEITRQCVYISWDLSVYGLSQWEEALLCNPFSH